MPVLSKIEDSERLDLLLGPRDSLEFLRRHAVEARRIEEGFGGKPDRAVVRFGNTANLGWEFGTNHREINFVVFPAQLRLETLDRINKVYQERGLKPLSGDPADLDSGREDRELCLPLEVAFDGVLDPQGDPVWPPGDAGRDRRDAWLQANPLLEMDPCHRETRESPIFGDFLSGQRIEYVLSGDAGRDADLNDDRIFVDNPESTVVDLCRRNLTSQYLDHVSGLGTLEPDGSGVKSGGRIHLAAGAVERAAERALKAGAYAHQNPVSLGTLEGGTAIRKVRTRRQELRAREAERAGELRAEAAGQELAD